MVAAAFTLSVFSGCTSDLQRDIDELTKRVDDLESVVEALDAKIVDGSMITSVTALEAPESGWLIEFSDGDHIKILNGTDGVTPKIEVRTNPDGSTTVWINTTAGYPEDGWENTGVDLDGVTPKIEVRNNADGTLTIWVNYTAGYPEDGWEDTGVDLSAPAGSNLLESIVMDEAGGTVTFTLPDGTKYTFPLASTAQSFAVMAVDAIAFGDTGAATFTFRVNPSNAWVPTGSGNSLTKWALDEVDTRASYVNPSEVFSLASILPDGEKQGQYIATVDFDIFAHDAGVNEYIMALVLNNNKSNETNEDSFISSAPFLFAPSPTEDELSVSTLDVEFYADGGTQTIRVISQGEWTATPQGNWFTVQKVDDSFTVTTTAYSDKQARTGSIVVSNALESKIVTVTQSGFVKVLNMGVIGEYGSAFGPGTSDILMFFQDYVPTGTMRDAGVQLLLNLGTPELDRSSNKRYLDIPAGEYIVSDNEQAYTVYTPLSSLQTVEFGFAVGTSFLQSGSITFEGDHNEYTVTFDLALEDGTTFLGKYVGPYIWENEEWVNPDFHYGDYLGNYTANGIPRFWIDRPGAPTWTGEVLEGPSSIAYTVTNAFNIAPENSHPIEVYPSGAMFFNTNVPLGQLGNGAVFCVAAFEDDNGQINFLATNATIPLTWDADARTIAFPETMKITAGMGERRMMFGIGLRNGSGQVTEVISDDLYENLVLTIAPGSAPAPYRSPSYAFTPACIPTGDNIPAQFEKAAGNLKRTR